MTHNGHSRRWRKPLFVGVVVLVAGAGVVVGAWLMPAGTSQTPPALGLPFTESVARAPAAASPPGPTIDAAPVARAMPADASDLSLLRARNLGLPVSGVGAAQLNDNYTQQRAGGVDHEALDIMAPRGTPVLAVEDGRIAKLFLSKPGGITLYQFDPSGTYAYYYAHLDGYADGIAEGGTLRKGQVIGYVGSTGNASPDAPHLHFAIFKLGIEKQWWRGTPINPFLVWRDTKP